MNTCINTNNVDIFTELVHSHGIDNLKESALHAAAFQGSLNIVKYLIENENVEVNHFDNENRTPLSYAVLMNKIDVVKYLLEEGANIELITNSFVQLLYQNNIEMINLLLNNGANPNKNPVLHLAVSRKKVTLIKRLLQKGADPNFDYEDIGTPLTLAVKTFSDEKPINLEIAKLLLECGANPKIESALQILFDAVEKGYKNIAKLLLKYGADPNIRDKSGNTPLHHAVKQNDVELVYELIRNGAVSSIENNRRESSLKLAIDFQESKRIRLCFSAYVSKFLSYGIHDLPNVFDFHGFGDYYASFAPNKQFNQLRKSLHLQNIGMSIDSDCWTNFTLINILLNNTALLYVNAKDIRIKILTDSSQNLCLRCLLLYAHASVAFYINKKHDKLHKDIVLILNIIQRQVHLQETEDYCISSYLHHINSYALLLYWEFAKDLSSTHIYDIICYQFSHVALVLDDRKLMRLILECNERVRFLPTEIFAGKNFMANFFKILMLLLRTYECFSAHVKTFQRKLISFAVDYQEVNILTAIFHFITDTDYVNDEKSSPYSIYTFGKYLEVNSTNHEGKTCLHWAVTLEDNFKLINLLIDAGADPNIADDNNEIPLFGAIHSKQFKTVKLLLEKLSDINIQDIHGHTILHEANSSASFTDLFLCAGADPNVKNNDNEIPLFGAIRKDKIKVAKLLLEKVVDINIQNIYGNTLLHEAKASASITELLLSKNADLSIVNKNKSTALHLAAYAGNVEVSEMLLQHGIDVNAEDYNGDIALHHAIRNEQAFRLVRVLLKHGSDVYKITHDTYSTLYTMFYKFVLVDEEIMQILKEKIGLEKLKQFCPSSAIKYMK